MSKNRKTLPFWKEWISSTRYFLLQTGKKMSVPAMKFSSLEFAVNLTTSIFLVYTVLDDSICDCLLS